MLTQIRKPSASQRDSASTADRLSSLRLGLLYVIPLAATDLLSIFVPSLLFWIGVLQLGLLVALLVVVARRRDDDLLEAGLFVGLVTGVENLFIQAVVASVNADTIWAGVLTLPGAFLGLLLRTVIVGAIAAGAIWVLRLVLPLKSVAAGPDAGSA